MRCRRIQEQLDAYLADGEHSLSTPDREQVENHLRKCKECRRELSRLRSLHRLLVETPVPPLPEGFASRVVARAKTRQAVAKTRLAVPVRSRWNAWQRLRLAAGSAAALAVGLALGAFLGNDVWQDDAGRRQAAAARQADVLAGASFGRLVVGDDDSLARAYLDLTFGRDG